MARYDAQVRGFMTVPGVGPITALASRRRLTIRRDQRLGRIGMHRIVYAHRGATPRQDPRRCLAGAAGAARHHRLSLPKIISGRSGDAIPPKSGWQQWRRIVELAASAARLSLEPSACGPRCSTPHKKKGLFAGAPRQRSAPGPGTRAAPYQSGAPHTHSAMAYVGSNGLISL